MRGDSLFLDIRLEIFSRSGSIQVATHDAKSCGCTICNLVSIYWVHWFGKCGFPVRQLSQGPSWLFLGLKHVSHFVLFGYNRLAPMTQDKEKLEALLREAEAESAKAAANGTQNTAVQQSTTTPTENA